MVNRTLFWDENQSRTFDYVQDSIDTMIGISQLAGDVLGQTATVVSGLAATASDPASLSISIAAGSIYQLADIDATTDGAISQNTTQILQQGIVGAPDRHTLDHRHRRRAITVAVDRGSILAERRRPLGRS